MTNRKKRGKMNEEKLRQETEELRQLLNTPCGYCGGKGEVERAGGQMQPCKECKGTGKVTWAQVKMLAELERQHAVPKANDRD